MELAFQVVMILVTLALLLVVWQLTMSGWFRPAYALLWLFTTALMLFVSLFQGIVLKLAAYFHVDYPPAILFAMGIVFITLILISQTAVISDFSRKNKELAQNYALLQYRLEELEKQINEVHYIQLETAEPAFDEKNPLFQTNRPENEEAKQPSELAVAGAEV
jgi:hypothetical protein